MARVSSPAIRACHAGLGLSPPPGAGGKGHGPGVSQGSRHTAEQCEVGGRDDANYEHRPPGSRAGGGAGVSAARRHLISWRGRLTAELRDRAGETYGMPPLNRLPVSSLPSVAFFPAPPCVFVSNTFLPLQFMASASTHGRPHFNRGCVDRWVRTLPAAGRRLLFANSDMWPPAVSFKRRSVKRAGEPPCAGPPPRDAHRGQLGRSQAGVGDTGCEKGSSIPWKADKAPSSFPGTPPQSARRQPRGRWVLAVQSPH